MLERYLEKDEARKLEMKLLLLSLYYDVYYMVNDLRRADRLLKASSSILMRNFDGELNELEKEVSLLVSEASKVLGGPLEELPDREDLRRVQESLRRTRAEVSDLISRIKREIELATSVIGEVLRRMPEAGVEVKLLAARMNEAPTKLDYMPTSYLGMLLDLMMNLLPHYDGDIGPIEEGLNDIRELLREAHSNIGSKVGDLIEVLAYLRFLVGKFKQLAPGVASYLEDLRSSSILLPRGSGDE